MGGYSFKLYVYIFENSQREHNNLDCPYFFEINFIICKVSILKF